MTNPLAVLQRQAAAALADIRNAAGELAAVLRPDWVIDDELLLPVRRLVKGLAGVAELAVGPMVQVVEIQRKFVEGQRTLADQMTSWAELQHHLADRMLAWAEMQRQVASALEVSLAPVSGAVDLTRRLLREVAHGADVDRIDGEEIAQDQAVHRSEPTRVQRRAAAKSGIAKSGTPKSGTPGSGTSRSGAANRSGSARSGTARPAPKKAAKRPTGR